MSRIYKIGTRVHVEFDAEYAGSDDEGYQTVRCFDQRNVFILRVPRNALIIEASDAATAGSVTPERGEQQ
jgi:hypothetical protein